PADPDAVARLAAALVDGAAGPGLAILGELDERGRDVAIILDQVVDQVRTELSAALAAGDGERAGRLAAAAHRLAAIDPERRGVGGLRFQLELALLDAATGDGSSQPGARRSAVAPDARHTDDRKSVVYGKSVDLGGRRIIKKKNI